MKLECVKVFSFIQLPLVKLGFLNFVWAATQPSYVCTSTWKTLTNNTCISWKVCLLRCTYRREIKVLPAIKEGNFSRYFFFLIRFATCIEMEPFMVQFSRNKSTKLKISDKKELGKLKPRENENGHYLVLFCFCKANNITQ